MLYIILPVHNRFDVTFNFIKCLELQSYKEYHLILVDDGSTDGSEKVADGKIKNFTLIKGNGDLWWAGSLQKGINWLIDNNIDKSSFVLFANDDISFESSFLEVGINLVKNRGGMVSANEVSFHDKNEIIIETGVKANFNNLTFEISKNPDEINCLPTRALFTTIENIVITGNFHPKVLPHYLSDYEYTYRALKKGIKLSTSNELLIQSNPFLSGYRKFSEISFWEFLQKYFSKKSVNNPIYYTNFVIFTSNYIFIPINIIRIWLGAIKNIFSFYLRKH